MAGEKQGPHLGSAEPDRTSLSSLRGFLSGLRFFFLDNSPSAASEGGGRRFRWGASNRPDAHIWRQRRQPGAFAGKRVQLPCPHHRRVAQCGSPGGEGAIPGTGTDLP